MWVGRAAGTAGATCTFPAHQGCQKWHGGETRHEPIPGSGAPLHPCMSPVSGLGQAERAQPSTDPLLPAGTCCSRGGRWEGQSTGHRGSTHLPPPPPFSGPCRAPSCSAPKIELIVHRASERFTGGCDCIIAWGGSAAWQGAWHHAQRSCLLLAATSLAGPGTTRLLLCLDSSQHRQPPGAGARQRAVPATWCPAMTAASGAWRSPGPPRGAGGAVPVPQPSCGAPIPSATCAGMRLVGEHWCHWGLWLVSGEPRGDAGATVANLEWQRERAGWRRRPEGREGSRGPWQCRR